MTITHIKELEKWCKEEYGHTVDKSPIAKAMFYMYTRFEQLSGYVNDAQLSSANAVRICMAESLRFLEEGSSAPG